MNDTTAMENRVKALEVAYVGLRLEVASLGITAGQALQNSLLNQAGMGSGGGGSPTLIYTTSVGTARVGPTAGQATYQIVFGIGTPPVMTSTGNALDQGQIAYNITGGTTPINAYGSIQNIGGANYYFIIDCLNTTNPGPPVNPSTAQINQSATAALVFQNGQGIINN